MERPLRRKQISIFIPVEDWKEIRMEAARQHIPMTELCRRWLRPELDRLHVQETTSAFNPHRESTGNSM
ncbi:MAG: hypothetical protein R3C11_14035 [Planctomycetaceae bacterium]